MPFFELEDRFAQVLMTGHIVKESAPCLSRDAFQNTPAPKRNHWLPTSEGLNRHYAEILFTGLNDRSTPGVLLSKFGLRNAPTEFYIPTRNLPELPKFGAVTHNPQRATVSGKTDDCIVNTLVLNKLRHYEEVIEG